MISDDSGGIELTYGGQSMSGPLRRVMVRRPAAPESESQWKAFNYVHPVDHAMSLVEHRALCDLLVGEGVDVIEATGDEPGDLDAIFTYDPSLITDQGVILLNMGKKQRIGEPSLHARMYADFGIPILGEITGAGTIEGGDTLWLDESTLAVGVGYRTNSDGVAQLRSILKPVGVTVLNYDLPHWTGLADCLHLMSFISPIAPHAALVHKPLMAVELLRELDRREWNLIGLPSHEFLSMGCNVLSLAPYRVVVVNGNPCTRTVLEGAGCTVTEYPGDHISHNRAGGPTCLTRPILRDREASD
ncbi:dimethylarginine dimethylaminohydrolase family protein [soil metagenome]